MLVRPGHPPWRWERHPEGGGCAEQVCLTEMASNSGRLDFRDVQPSGTDELKKIQGALENNHGSGKSSGIQWRSILSSCKAHGPISENGLFRRSGIIKKRRQGGAEAKSLVTLGNRRIQCNQQIMTKNALTNRNRRWQRGATQACLTASVAASVSFCCMSVGVPVSVLTAVPVLVTVTVTVTPASRRRRRSLSTA